MYPARMTKKSISETHPDLAEEAYGWDPKEISHGSNRKLDWKCPIGHIYSSKPNSRSNGHTGCPYCANQKVLIGFNDFQSNHPELAKEAHGWDTTSITKRSGKKFEWICAKQHVWKSTVDNRVKGTGCPICDGKQILIGYNDLQTTHPEIAKQAVDWEPKEFNAGSQKKVSWKCEKNHSWKAIIASRALNGNNCPICSNQRILKGFNDLGTLHRELASEAYGWDPSTILAGTNKQLDWKCKNSHIYSAPANRRISGESGCPYCSNNRVLSGFNDLATTNPNLASEADGWDPSKYLAGANKKFKWVCESGHRWKAQLNSRNQGIGCPSCAISGFDPNKDGYLYLLDHPRWDMLQIGITNDPDSRLSKHKRLGWVVTEVRGPMDGHLTNQWETAILRMLRFRKADLANSQIAGKFDGYSEAWSESTFPVKSIKEIMRMTEEFEEENKGLQE